MTSILARFCILLAVLVILGSLFVFQASTVESFTTFGNPYHFFQQHILGVIAGVVLLTCMAYLPLKPLLQISPALFVGSIILCLLVFIPGIGLELNGARRWLSLGSFVFQPVEALKLGLILYYAHWLSIHQRLNTFIYATGIAAVVLILQPDLGSLILVTTIAVGLYFLSGVALKKIGILVAIAIPLIILAIFTSSYRMERLQTFLNPSSDPLGSSFHYRQLLLALGRGGVIGQGLGKSNQKYAYVPEASTDSIFAIIAEEIGFVGSVSILLLFGYLLFLGHTLIMLSSASHPEKLAAMGVLVWIGLQCLLNLGAIAGLVPLTGTPLPFFSYGRSALVMLLCATGIVINVGRRI